LQIGAKLLFAFVFVILIMTLGCAGYTLYIDYTSTRQIAADKLRKAVHQISDQSSGGDLERISSANAQLGEAMLHDKSIWNACNSQDKSALNSSIKAFISKTNFNGFVAFIDNSGSVLYSTESPAGSRYSVRDCSAVEAVLSRGMVYKGAVALTPNGSLSASGIVPIVSKGVVGALAVCTPLNLEFLTGLMEKMAVSQDHLSDVDICIMSGKDLVSLTPNLIANGGGFIKDLKERGADAIPGDLPIPSWVPWPRKEQQGFEAGGRWWKQLFLPGLENRLIGEILVTTPVPDIGAQLTQVALLASACGAVGLLFAMYFASGISRDVNEPLRFLIDRTEAIANQKTSLPPLENLSGDWLELGEQIDTAVSAMRSTVQSLKQQLGKQQAETKEQNKETDDVGIQLDALNMQFSQQAKQLTEATKQLSAANKQVVLLQHKLDSVLQCSTEGFLLLDQFGNVLSANPVFLHWIGGSEGEIAGRLCFDLVKRPGEQPNSLHEGQAFARHGGDPHELINQFYPEGVIYHRYQQSSVEVLAHLQPVMSEDQGIAGYIMVLRDKSLRSEIAQLRQEMVSVLSASIREPLALAEQGWNAILTNAAQTMHPSVGQHLAELHKHYEQLLSLVDSLLLMYGGFVPPPAMPKDQVVIPRLVADCLEEVAPMARSNQLSLDYKSSSGLPSVGMDKDVVRKILSDVLMQMITITAPGGRVRVESMMKGSELRIGVQSSGPALPEVEITDMFAGFIEGRHHEATYSARLAMYLARNSVERLGGKIWAVSEQGRGTVIYFGVPVQLVG
jgi:signal transduction histidine kinase